MSGTTADVVAALDGTFGAGYTGNITLLRYHDLVSLKKINNALRRDHTKFSQCSLKWYSF